MNNAKNVLVTIVNEEIARRMFKIQRIRDSNNHSKSLKIVAQMAQLAQIHTYGEPLSEIERDLLKKFRNKVDKFKHVLCPTCNESFPSIVRPGQLDFLFNKDFC